ncbi:hypothetical protein [Pyrobaculum calidifontis]|uniref:Uncharacterized protein n=1 Tax=Pyrobaculum calidifontis (strain DSM 21063 / JCM 11548 / VA1) TaxID=410359 RepID=A3MVC5_PYRCJ|nr:hypothetical protein [Pyrobaculum calidifontis]ABO08592.1 conserved hypothetical protein [Pyrobaculum calidifontis JCM 11548]
MIPRGDILRGVRDTPLVALLLEFEELKPSPKLRPLLELLAELGVLAKRGDAYVKADARPPTGEKSALSEAIGVVLHQLVVPHLASGATATRLTPELKQSLYIYTSIFQTLRIVAAQELLRYGGLTLVAGWFPCGFSSELMSISGRDVVIVEEREDLLTLEIDRLSLLPLAAAPVEEGLAPASFYSFEVMPLGEVSQLVDKYGKFDTAIVCGRGVDIDAVRRAAEEVYYIHIGDKALSTLNSLVLKSLGLQPPTDEAPKAPRRGNLDGFEIYIW